MDRFQFSVGIAVSVCLASGSVLAELKTVRSTICTNSNLTRYVYLREDAGDRVPCEVLYAKPDEGGTIETSWQAQNDVGYCERHYIAFVEKLEYELGWSCLIPLPPRTGPTTSSVPDSVEGNVPIRRIIAGGHVEVRYPDGTVVEIWDGESKTTYPDGSVETVSLSQVSFPVPPTPAPGSTEEAWLGRAADTLLETIRSLVHFDEPSVNNYLSTEPGANVHEQIDSRLAVVRRLLQK